MLINTIRKLYYMRVDGIFICSKVASYVLKINKQGGQNEVALAGFCIRILQNLCLEFQNF